MNQSKATINKITPNMIQLLINHYEKFDICDQICKNQPSLHQVTRHTFHYKSIATPMN